MPFFSGPAASRCSNACLYKGSRKKSKNWLRRTNIKSNLTLKIEYFTKTKELRCQAVIFALHHTKVQMSTPFLRDRPWNFAHVFNVSLSSLLRMFVFSQEMWDPLRPKKKQISGEKKKKKKKPLRKRLGRGTLNTWKNQGLSLKNGVDVGLWRNSGFCAWTSLHTKILPGNKK